MTAPPSTDAADAFARTFGSSRGSGRDDTHGMPVSPDGQAPCVAVRRPGALSWEWLIGWYGSPLTVSIDTDTGRSLWTRHPHALADGAAHAHLRQPWTAIPDQVKTIALRAVAEGPDELTGTSTDAPLTP